MKKFCFSVIKNNLEIVLRLDYYLSRKIINISRMYIKHLIELGHVSIKNIIIFDPNYTLQNGYCIFFRMPDIDNFLYVNPLHLNIIFEDDNIIIINKPIGLVVHPSKGHISDTLFNAILYHCGNSFLNRSKSFRSGIVHRLDKNTSGLIIVSKSRKSYINLIKQFSNRNIKRIYIGLVWGIFNNLFGVINKPITHNHHLNHKMIVSQSGKNAITSYRVLKSFGADLSLMEFQLFSGRTHQIRLHMSSINHSIVGDSIYGGVSKRKFVKQYDFLEKKITEHFLHAKFLSFIHPVSGKKMVFYADLPQSFKNFLYIL